MTNECWICGKQEAMPYKCRYCGKTYCSDHRLPEQHGCTGFDDTEQHGFSGTHGNTQSQNTDAGKIIKDMLKNTAKHAAKDAAIRSFDRIKRSFYSSPSMAIIYVCIVSFLLQFIMRNYGYVEFFWLLPTSPQYLILFTKPWTLITHMFLHANLTHLFFNMLVLFFFGRELEHRVGNRVFLNVFFTSGIVAAIGYTLTGTGPMIGASGAIYGVFACIAVLAPEIRVYVYFIPMRIKQALVLFAVMDLVLIGAPDMIAHTAHLSGVFVGILMGMRIKKAYNARRFGKAHDYYSQR